jgi:hypothetical protein
MAGRGVLIDQRMADGSRLFLTLPQSVSPDVAVAHLKTLAGAELVEFLDGVMESWIDFRYLRNDFSIHNPYGEFWFFVKDPDCPGVVLEAVQGHFSCMLRESGER